MFRKIVFICSLYIPAAFAGDSHPSIDDIQARPPIERIQIYTSMLQNNSIPFEIKNQLIKAFAQDARHLSPLYGKGSVKMNHKQWIDWLSQGKDSFPEDQNIIFALVQHLINNKQYKQALQIIAPYRKKHPNHETTAWLDYCSEQIREKPSQAH